MIKSSSKYLIASLSGWGFTWQGLLNNRRGEWWLLGQITIIAAHFLPSIHQTYPIRTYWEGLDLGIYLFILGLILAAIALISLGKNLSPLPEPKVNSSLIISGAYRNCRHPLYQAILICSFGIFVYLGSLLHLLLFILSCIILRGKALREERTLLKLHHEYLSYKLNTPAILPYIPYLDWRS